MKLLKRLLLIFSIFLVLFIGILLAIPVFFRDELVALVKEQINANINATADFSDVDISLFRSFPHLGLLLSDFSIVGKDVFEGIPLVTAKEAGITVNLKSLMGSNQPFEIRKVNLEQPFVNVMVLADGTANYDIALPTDETVPEDEAPADSLVIALRTYSITDGRIVYDDRSSDTFMEIEGLNHNGKGDFTLSVFDLVTHTDIAAMTVRQGGIPYLKKAQLDLDATFNIDNDVSKYTLKDNQLVINAMQVNADGYVQLKEEDILMDLKFNAPSSDFRALWSLIPNAYTADYDDVKISGKFKLEGMAKGTYNETTYPAFRIQTRIENGNVKYPDLPMGISDINAFFDVNSPSSDLNAMQVTGSNIGIKVGGDPFRANFKVRTPISDPDVEADVDGIIDLAKWAKAFPLEGIQEMTGRIIADVDMKTRLSTIEREDYANVKMAGDVRIEKLRYKADDMPLVVIDQSVFQFTPQRLVVNSFTAQLGKSDLSASGSIDNILAYISPEKTMRGNFTVHTNYFFVDEWMTETEPATETPAVPTVAPAEEEAMFDRFDFALDATAGKIVYEDYTLTNAALKGRMRPNLLEVQNIRTNLGESDFSGSGTIRNMFDYLFSDGTLGGELAFQSNYLDLNPFMEETTPAAATGSTPASTESYGVIPIPANIAMTVNAKVGKLRYTDMELNNMTGKLTIADESVVIEDGFAKALGGSMGFIGAYDTKDIEKPTYSFKFDLNQLDFQQSFNTFNSFASFAPVGKLVTGKFTTNLIMEGVLGQDMMPKLESVNAKGLIETLNGSLKGVAPLNAIGNALDIKELKDNVKFDNLKSWFTIANGLFTVEPFDVKVANMPMTIAGTHSLTQEMNYTINTVIPRSKLGTGALGNTVNQGVSALIKQAGQLGLNVNDAETLNVQILLTGSMTKPKVGFKLLGTDGKMTVQETVKTEIKAEVGKQIDAVKDQVKTEVDAAKERAKAEGQRALDSAKVVADKKIEEAKQRALEEARKRAGTVLDSTKIGTDVRNQAEGAIDKIKGDIQDFNPFKKKKSGGG